MECRKRAHYSSRKNPHDTAEDLDVLRVDRLIDEFSGWRRTRRFSR